MCSGISTSDAYCRAGVPVHVMCIAQSFPSTVASTFTAHANPLSEWLALAMLFVFGWFATDAVLAVI